MNKWALYHDFDELKCEVIREAIKALAITDGEVICGDIKQLTADDVRGFKRCHFFAGGGFWDLALNIAGWGDEPVWTGSCPCPSFSAAGKGGGFDDPRHLWPDWAKLIRECRPPVVFGEQADDAVGYGWVDLVQTDLEAASYAFGKIVFGACSVGAPHIRQRLYFCADTLRDRAGHVAGEGLGAEAAPHSEDGSLPRERLRFGGEGSTSLGADTASSGHDGRRPGEESGGEVQARRQPKRPRDAGLSSNTHPDRFSSDAGSGLHDEEHHPEPRLCALISPDTHSESRERGAGSLPRAQAQSDGEWFAVDGRGPVGPEHGEQAGGGKHPISTRLQGLSGDVREWRGPGWLDPLTARSIAEAGATRGFWADCDWWYGRDGKYRPIGPSLQPLAHGSAARVGRLRLYGDAICIDAAAEFIKAYRETKGEVIHGNPK